MPGTDEWCPNGIHSWETDRLVAAANKWKINPQYLSIKQVPGQPTPPPPPPEPKPEPAPEPPAEPAAEQLTLF